MSCWTEEEIRFLIDNYPNLDNACISNHLNRGFPSIQNKASSLGLKKTRETVAETATSNAFSKLEKLNKLPLTDVPSNIRFKHRGWLTHLYIDKEYSVQDIAEITGTTRKNVEYWMKRNEIPRRDIESRYTDRYLRKISETSKGRTPFNKGLTKQDHPSIMKISGKMSGNRSRFWKGGSCITTCGYRLTRVDDHPNRDKDDYVLEHRLVMETLLGRYLRSEEVVHHRDRDRLNNSPDNLFLFPCKKSHTCFHNYQNYVDPNIKEEKFMEEIFYEKYSA
ncbi:hypothetical protein B4117_4316 [Bacillus mycoides]|uniref:HNH endonuclease n=1 Tax=Bacillus mycoides TaxID=1405 RepID=UPI0007ABCE2C|nr:HNH endonuclease [Bacillus mycoides]KZE04146.1 hypothetical protein B4117_4316 [Bacillus mycoides]